MYSNEYGIQCIQMNKQLLFNLNLKSWTDDGKYRFSHIKHLSLAIDNTFEFRHEKTCL